MATLKNESTGLTYRINRFGSRTFEVYVSKPTSAIGPISAQWKTNLEGAKRAWEEALKQGCIPTEGSSVGML